ncbi:hypothetical protein [Roseococcus sp. YIM B11640]|uniref:hypothetical protein n=1 Tax=Roseococcus sp. YIM B11640 TaxID=3133973 RepID=UPI003C7DB9DE
MRLPLTLIAAMALATPSFAQQTGSGTEPTGSSQTRAQGCNPSGRAEAATPPQAGRADGTAPGQATTGWTGGMGGSHTGTNTQGAVQTSPTWHAPTARGLDPIANPAPPEAAC